MDARDKPKLLLARLCRGRNGECEAVSEARGMRVPACDARGSSKRLSIAARQESSLI